MEIVTTVIAQIWQVWVDTALWLCVGLLFAAFAHIYLRTEHLQRWLARPGPGSVFKATILGAPLPLCSCGVLPAAIGLKRAGASREASAAFLISTPETGVDSVSVSYALLGPFYAILRPIAALLTAFSAGLAVWKWGGEEPARASVEQPKACCGGHEHADDQAAKNQKVSVWGGVRYAFTDLLDDLAGWLVFGVALAGLILALVPPELLAEFGRSPWALLLMLLVGVPLYVCAVASTPIAAALLVAGVSPGAVLVFLLAGPATNLGGLGLIAKEFGRRFAGIYLATICCFSLGLGYFVDTVLPADWFLPVLADSHQHSGEIPLAMLAAFALALWIFWRWFKPIVFERV